MFVKNEQSHLILSLTGQFLKNNTVIALVLDTMSSHEFFPRVRMPTKRLQKLRRGLTTPFRQLQARG